MQYKGSTTIKRRPKDGIPGKDAHSPYIGVNGNWYFWDDATDKFKDSGLSAQGDDGHSPYINTSTNTWYEWNVETGAYKDTGIKAIGVDGEPGGPGSDGLPGQIPFQKEWKQGDTHRYNDNIIDYIYVRGANKDQSYWYKRVAKGDVTAGVPPTGGTTPTGYERVDWLNNLAVNVLIAEEANIANFIFKDGVFWSLKGTVDGVEADYTGQTNFIPNVVIDGKTGKIKANDAEITGTINALSGTIAGWNISSGRIGKVQTSTGLPTATGLSLYDSFIKFSDADSSVFLGTNVLPASSGMVGMGRITNTNSNIRKIGMYFDMAGADTGFWDGSSNNIAMYINRGVIAGAKFNGVNHNLGASGYTIGKETIVCIYTTQNYTVRLPSNPEPWEFKWLFGINNNNYTLSGNGKNIWSPFSGSVSSMTFGSGVVVYTGQQWAVFA